MSTVPLGGGLSSSASLEMSIFTLLEALYGKGNNVPLDVKAKCCQLAEHTFAHMPCGIMDQFIAAMGQAKHALLIDCRSLEARRVPLVDPNVVVLITNSNVRHALSGSQYPVRRQQCHTAAGVLGVEKLRDATMMKLKECESKLDEVVFRRARHVITENDRCERAAKALEESNYAEFGQLMTDSHASMRDDYDVSCVELDELVSIACKVKGVYGSRMTGGGFGGCMVTLVKSESVQHLIEEIKRLYSGRPEFYICQACDGARQLTIPQS